MSDPDTDEDTQLEYGSDPDLSSEEKETTIRIANDIETMHIASEQRVVVEWLDHHPHFVEDERRITDGRLVGIIGTLPVGCLQLKGFPRKSTATARVLGKLDVDGNSTATAQQQPPEEEPAPAADD